MNIYSIFEDEKAPIYFIIPGFLGNYSENFIKDLHDFLVEKDRSFVGVSFRGYGSEEDELATLEEMVENVKDEFFAIRKKYPRRRIVILAHSQGCAVSLKSASCFDDNTSFILFAPAIFIDKIILPRINDDDRRNIDDCDSLIRCKVSREKFRMINRKWIMSYQNFSVLDALDNIKQRCIIVRPVDDYIDRENVDILLEKISNKTYMEVAGDHAFFCPEGAFSELVKKIFLC